MLKRRLPCVPQKVTLTLKGTKKGNRSFKLTAVERKCLARMQR